MVDMESLLILICLNLAFLLDWIIYFDDLSQEEILIIGDLSSPLSLYNLSSYTKYINNYRILEGTSLRIAEYYLSEFSILSEGLSKYSSIIFSISEFI